DHEVACALERDALVAQPLELLLHRVAQRIAVLVFHVVARNRGNDLVAAHADVTVNPPHRHDDVVTAQRPVPRERMLVVRVDERAVEVQQRRVGQDAACVFCACFACFPSAISSIIFLLNAGMSSGLRLVTSPASTTTSSSTQFAPALRRSVCSVGHEVTLRSRTTPASTRTHGAWQIAATGLPCSKNSRTNETMFSSP